MTKFKVGDRLSLTGEGWGWPKLMKGDTVTVVETDGDYLKLSEAYEWVLVGGPGYEVALNTDTPEEHLAKLKASSFEQNVRRITDQIADLLIAKNKAYGDSALNPIRVFSKSDRIEGLYQRIDDKLSRVSRGTDYPGDDTVKDLIGYLCLLLIARESE